MKKYLKTMIVLVIMACITLQPFFQSSQQDTSIVYAHSGRTDSSGGHRDNKNKSGLGSYHYHCGGHGPHLHKNGTCPYDTSKKETTSKKTTSKKTTSKKTTISKATIKKVQAALNELGYDCGKPDGVRGKDTKAAIKAYRKEHDLKNSTTIDDKLLDSLGIKN